jgi:hypothetical protein
MSEELCVKGYELSFFLYFCTQNKGIINDERKNTCFFGTSFLA